MFMTMKAIIIFANVVTAQDPVRLFPRLFLRTRPFSKVPPVKVAGLWLGVRFLGVTTGRIRWRWSFRGLWLAGRLLLWWGFLHCRVLGSLFLGGGVFGRGSSGGFRVRRVGSRILLRIRRLRRLCTGV